MAATLLVEVAFNANPSDPAPVYTDISAYVRSCAIRRGRQHELDQQQAGIATLTLTNSDGRFDPTNDGTNSGNLVSNSSVETDATGYTANNGAIARSSAAGVAYVGSYGIVATTTNTNDSGVYYGDIPVTVGVAYTASWYVRLASAGSKSMETLIVWFDSGDNVIGFAETLFTLNWTTYARVSVTGTAPATTTYAQIYIQTKIAGGVFDFWTDAVQFEVASGTIVNLIENPSLEVDTTGYVGTGSGSIARSNSAGVPYIDSYGLDVTTANLSDSGVKYQTFGTITSGLDHTFSFYARLASAGSKAMAIYIDWYDEDTILIGEDYTPFTLDSTTYARFSLSGTSPNLASFAQIYVITEGVNGIFHYYLDALQFESSSPLGLNRVINSSFEVDTSGYAAIDGSIARSNAAGVPRSGSWGLVVTTTNIIYSGFEYRPNSAVRVTPGQAYVFSAYVRLASAGSKAMAIYLSWYDASSVFLSEVYQPFTLNSTTYARFTATGTAPVGADRAVLSILTDSAGLGIFDFWVDDLQVESGSSPNVYVDGVAVSATTYVDGAQAGDYWEGTAHASPSGIASPSTFIEAAPYAPFVLPMRRIKISGVHSAVTYPLFSGFIEGWPQVWFGNNVSEVTITASDGFKVLGLKNLTASYAAERSDIRLSNVLDDIGWSTAARDLTDGISYLSSATLEDVNSLAYAQSVVQTENGRHYISASGGYLFRDRHAPFASTANNATFGDNSTELGYTGIIVSYDDTQIYNEIRCAIQFEDDKVAADTATSQLRYFTRTMSRREMLTPDGNEAQAAANFLLSQYKDPALRIMSIDIMPDTDPTNLYPQVYGRELGDRVLVKRRPSAGNTISQQSFIEGIEFNFAIGTLTKVTWRLSAVGIGYSLGTPIILDGDTSYIWTSTGTSGVLVY